MISPASFNYYQECVARAEELISIINQSITPQVIKDDLWNRVHALLADVPFGYLITD